MSTTDGLPGSIKTRNEREVEMRIQDLKNIIDTMETGTTLSTFLAEQVYVEVRSTDGKITTPLTNSYSIDYDEHNVPMCLNLRLDET